jgi:hypothetical protein
MVSDLLHEDVFDELLVGHNVSSSIAQQEIGDCSHVLWVVCGSRLGVEHSVRNELQQRQFVLGCRSPGA